MYDYEITRYARVARSNVPWAPMALVTMCMQTAAFNQVHSTWYIQLGAFTRDKAAIGNQPGEIVIIWISTLAENRFNSAYPRNY